METRTAIAVDYVRKDAGPPPREFIDSRTFRVEDEAQARAFLAERLPLGLAVLSTRIERTDGRSFHAVWITDTGRILCEHSGVLGP